DPLFTWRQYASLRIPLPRLQETFLEDPISRRLGKGPRRVPEMRQQESRAAVVCLYRDHVEKERVNVRGSTYALRQVCLRFHPEAPHPGLIGEYTRCTPNNSFGLPMRGTSPLRSTSTATRVVSFCGRKYRTGKASE